ncbi:hypothetical protein [Limnohabitans sp. JirII-31]|uniref:hypothetical protein n=1 Tax=Limnohabitans sp. JirII-31 TaxID=1977908 RepID=UPI00117A0139|nr:hypothetical protein [Limnohabitans sp. JirII-31]
MLALLAMCGVIQAYAQTGTVMTSAQTVEALLQAENKAVFERANPASAPAQARQIAASEVELTLLSVYGLGSELQVDLKYGDLRFKRLVVGDHAGPWVVAAIHGMCVDLVGADALKNKTRQVVCWTLSASVDPRPSVAPSPAGALPVGAPPTGPLPTGALSPVGSIADPSLLQGLMSGMPLGRPTTDARLSAPKQ